MKIGITGHQDLPSNAARFFEDNLISLLEDTEVDAGISCLAKGADQLFSRVLLDAGQLLQVVVPCQHYERTFDDRIALQSYRELLFRASDVEYLPYSEPSENAFLAAGYRIVDRADLLLALWDGLPAKGVGGTGDIVQYARAQAKHVLVLWPRGVSR
ncbi:MAG: hypothetical protein ABI612_10795 [Betaproteobacteria bacterium]